MTAEEEWRPVPGAPGYEVSNFGRVVSYRWGYRRERRPWLNKGGYLTIDLRTREGVRLTRTIHRLVAELFIGPRPPGLETRHLDGDKSNNFVANLSYGSRSRNILDQVAHGVHNQATKTRCRNDHPYNDVNTRHLADGSRECKICRRETKRRYLVRQALRAASVEERAA